MAKTKLPWTLERVSRNVFNIRMVASKSWEQWILLRSDVHHDNPKCDQKLEKKHLEQAVERDAIIIDNGDLFCAMQGKYDKRSNKDAVREEHQAGDYLDKLVKTAADFYHPYRMHFAILGLGNHETAIRGRHETDLNDRLSELMRRDGGITQSSGYSGWIRMHATAYRTERHSLLLHHYHGSGGGGPVTRGVIGTNRRAVYTPDADILLSGHTHDEWLVTVPRQRLNQHNLVTRDEVTHVCVPGYKDAWNDGHSGWEVETAKGPKPIGSCWIRLYYDAPEKALVKEFTWAK